MSIVRQTRVKVLEIAEVNCWGLRWVRIKEVMTGEAIMGVPAFKGIKAGGEGKMKIKWKSSGMAPEQEVETGKKKV